MGNLRFLNILGTCWLVLVFSSLLTAQESEKAESRSDGLKVGMFQRGEGSYYADKFHGRQTASGEPFDMYEMTAAHKTLPFGTVLTVTNLNNAKKITVRVNDRGPYIAGRIIDVSKKAAELLHLIGPGVAPVEIVILALPKTRSSAAIAIREENTTPQKIPPNKRYAIQIASYAKAEHAQRQLDKLKKSGLPIHLERFGKYYRLILPELKWEQVGQYRKELARLGLSDVLVRQE